MRVRAVILAAVLMPEPTLAPDLMALTCLKAGFLLIA
jgi:hypothetical protein